LTSVFFSRLVWGGPQGGPARYVIARLVDLRSIKPRRATRRTWSH